LPEISIKKLTAQEHVRAAEILELKGDIENFQRELGIFTRLKEKTLDPEIRKLLAGIIMDEITLINAYHGEIKENEG
jgi:hypothetical protein